MRKNIDLQIKNFLKDKKCSLKNGIYLYNEFCENYLKCNYLSFCNVLAEHINNLGRV